MKCVAPYAMPYVRIKESISDAKGIRVDIYEKRQCPDPKVPVLKLSKSEDASAVEMPPVRHVQGQP